MPVCGRTRALGTMWYENVDSRLPQTAGRRRRQDAGMTSGRADIVGATRESPAIRRCRVADGRARVGAGLGPVRTRSTAPTGNQPLQPGPATPSRFSN